ncbi:elongation factor P [Patescibacteria group bacterium]|nr:elongation factor P [Patescibacteria group bacterium]
MARLTYNELKVGTIFVKDGAPFKVLDYAFVRMQQRKPVAQLKMVNLLSGKVQEYTANQNESFEEAEIEMMPVVFIYVNRGEYWFNEKGNPKNRFQLSSDVIGQAAQFLKGGTEVTAYKFGEKFISIELPIKMELEVTEAPPAIKGDTASGGGKTVTLETGAKINAPLFINTGDIVRVNTQTGEYAERVEKAS